MEERVHFCDHSSLKYICLKYGHDFYNTGKWRVDNNKEFSEFSNLHLRFVGSCCQL